MARNPELDHEFKENKTREKQVPLIYRDHDGINEPYEMMAINQAGGLKLKGWKQKLIMAIVADDTGIPLNELVFKSIKLVEKK